MCCLNIIEEFKQPPAWPSNSDDFLSNFINVFLVYLERAVFLNSAATFFLSQPIGVGASFLRTADKFVRLTNLK